MDAAAEIRVEVARRGWSHERLAEAAGVSRPVIGLAMSGTGPIGAASAQKILETLFPSMELGQRALIFQALCTVEGSKRHG